MKRVLIFVEGQTEETFVRDVIAPAFFHLQIFITPVLAQTSPSQKGGIVSYGKVKHQLIRLCKQDRQAIVTTLIDYYGLPKDFPGLDSDSNQSDIYTKVSILEQALAADINQPNFIPNYLIHEFEALLFCQPEKFADWLDDESPIPALRRIKEQFTSPERINDDPNTAPSKRITALIPGYKKTLHGPLIAEDIGLDEIKQQCSHFRQWIERLCALNK